jgi:diguanylate cyclase (GGDEF)-like protein
MDRESTPTTAEAALEKQVNTESLVILYKGLPNAAFGHVVTASFVFLGLSPVINFDTLLYWWLAVVVVASSRLVYSFLFLKSWPDINDEKIKLWSRSLIFLAFVQTCLWGIGVIFLWPDDIAYRAVLVAILAGVIAAGGIMLAAHRRSFWIYCLPIALPTVFMLVNSGERLDLIMAALIALYSGLMLISVNSLTNNFLAGMESRFRLQALSRTDPLTQLSNRRAFDEFLSEVWQQSIRTSQSVGILVIDVDQFKSYNDRYGHPQGDEALKQLASVLRDVASRSTDMCARVGGEEFVILMAATDDEGSLQVAREVQKKLEEERIEHQASATGLLTVSIGINNVVPDKNAATETFIEHADQALYRAKDLGRNRIEITGSDGAQVN